MSARFTLAPQEAPLPAGFHLTPGQTHNLESADAFRPGEQGKTVIADKACDVRSRVIGTLLPTGTEVVPSCGKEQREDDVDLYKAHHAIENFFEPVQSLSVRGERADQDGLKGANRRWAS